MLVDVAVVLIDAVVAVPVAVAAVVLVDMRVADFAVC